LQPNGKRIQAGSVHKFLSDQKLRDYQFMQIFDDNLLTSLPPPQRVVVALISRPV